MTLVVGTNTYINETDADTYFNTRYNSSFWSTLSSAQKETLLVSATRALDIYSDWLYSKYDSEQDLEFPRGDSNEIPEKIKIAELEIAVSIYENNNVVEEREQALKKLKADVIEFEFVETYSKTSTLYSDFTQRLLKPFTVSSLKNLVRV